MPGGESRFRGLFKAAKDNVVNESKASKAAAAAAKGSIKAPPPQAPKGKSPGKVTAPAVNARAAAAGAAAGGGKASGAGGRAKGSSRLTDSGNSQSTSLEGMLGIELAFDHLYECEKQLSSGSFGKVWSCKHRLNGGEFAVKVVDRTRLKPKDDASVFREVSILRALQGTFGGIVNLVDFFESPRTFHVILELARGGDVFDRLAKKTVYTEKDARELARNLLLAVQYVHSCGIVHRDLKPENMLLVDEVSDTNTKLADFGFAKRLSDTPGGLRTRCGTPAFVAPEILLGTPYGSSVDMWSVGVILYLLLGGYPPFQHENSKGLFRKIRAADYVFHDKYWDNISVQAKQLIAALLQVDPAVRLDAHAALKSEWMNADDEELSGRDLSSSLTEIRKFNARRRLKSAIHAVTWAVTASFWNADTVSFSGRETTADVVSNWVVGGTKTSKCGAASGSVGGSQDAATKAASRAETKRLMNAKLGKTFKDLYELTKKIRTGSFATVWEGRHRETGRVVAVKVVRRKDLKPKDDAQFLNEVAILQSLKHRHIVALHDFYEEKEFFYMVMELLNGGDVFDRIVEKNHYTELDARDLAKVLLDAVAYMHDRGVAHRDLKPQNLLLVSKEDDADIKVADFGFSKRVHTPQSLVTRCGTPTYVAPEVLKNHPHDQSVDLWSVGIIVYVLLVGYPPFMEENQRTLFRKIRMGEYEFFEEDWCGISDDAKDLIQKLLVVDPHHRITARAALEHEWISGDNDDDLSSRELRGSLQGLRTSLDSLGSDGKGPVNGGEAVQTEWLTEDRLIPEKTAQPKV